MVSILYKIYIKVNIHKKYTHAQQERQEGEEVCQMLTVVIRGVGRLGLISFSVLFSMFILSHSENHLLCFVLTKRIDYYKYNVNRIVSGTVHKMRKNKSEYANFSESTFRINKS